MPQQPSLCRRLAIATIAAALLVAVAPGAASASTYTAHDGASLSDAVASAGSHPGPNTIELRAGTYVPQSTLTLRGDVTLVGPATGPGGVKIDGGAVAPTGADLFAISSGAKAKFINVAMTTAGAPGSAAAIDDSGSVELDSSTLAGNNGPGLIVQPGATATVRNSTLSDGLDVGLVDRGTVKLYNATVTANANGGVDNAGGALALVNTIVARNGSPDCFAPAAASDHSLDGDGSCGVGPLGRSDPKLESLSLRNGGPTPTHALAAGSPAIDAGDNAQCPAQDQRHYARADGHCDIGAFEAGAAALPTGGGSGPGSGRSGPGTNSPGQTGARGFVGVSGRGALRGRKRARIAFKVRAVVGEQRGTFVYDDRGGRVRLRATTVSSLVIDAGRATATIKGSGREQFSGRRVSFTAVLARTRRSLRIRLSSGYAKSGRLLSGQISFTRARATAR